MVITAAHALKEYDVLGRGDWRQREEVRNLPKRDRDDLALWLMEQTYRYCRALGDRPNSPGDRQRAIQALDRVSTTPPLQAFESLRRRLLSRLNRVRRYDPQIREPTELKPAADSRLEPITSQPIEPPWLDDYLLGVAAELESGNEPEMAPESPSSAAVSDTRRTESITESGEDALPLRSASRALEHYERVLTRSPDSFWAHYRAAVACFQLQRWSEAAGHLDCCLRRRSENAALRGQFASCLSQMGFLDNALEECSRAVESAPDYAEFYRSRTFIRVSLGQADGLEDDLQRFEMLKRSLTRVFFRDPPGQGTGNPLPATVPASQRALDLDFNPGFTAQPGDPLVEPDDVDPEELTARAALAVTIISKAGTTWLRDDSADADRTKPGGHAGTPNALTIAAAQLEKILAIDSRNITARMARMAQLLEQRRLEEVRNDLDLLLNRPELISELRKDPRLFLFLHQAVKRFARRGLIAESLRIADMTVSCSIELKQYQSRSYYFRAVALSVAARSDPLQIVYAAKQLQYAIHGNPKFRIWYQGEKMFDPVRAGRRRARLAARDHPE